MIIITALLLPGFLFSQNDSRIKEDIKTYPLTFDKSKFLTEIKSANEKEIPEADYKIIASNNYYLEIEFTPYFYPRGMIKYDNKEYAILDFEGSVSKSLKDAGQPDVRSRSFGVMFPSLNNNTVTIVDYDVNEIKGLTVAPVPTAKLRDFNNRNFENVDLAYLPNSQAYNKNFLFPDNPAMVTGLDEVRDVIMGNLIISPIQYNPATGIIKQYTRIRVRINFGQSPVPLNKPRTRDEISLLKDAAINSSQGLTWMNPKLAGYKPAVTPLHSVLAEGDWYKIEIKDNTGINNPNGLSDGIYKLTKNYITGAGISLNGIDPRQIRIFGNGGFPLSKS
ncbi:MAG: C25 family peptidase propeptide domain-containing protein, partial [Saprospiraceae bacterium]